MPNAIVLIIDGLQAGFLGCYGNTWVDTPAANRLATEAACFEFAMTDSVRIESLYSSYWSGVHTLARETARTGQGPMLRELAAAGVPQTLVSDAPELFPNELVEPIESHIVVPLAETSQPAATIDATHTAEFINAAIEQLPTGGESQLLWLHTQGACAPWDAPLELREQLRDEEDPPPRETADVPHWILPSDHDPDDLLQITQAYAAQVMLFDHGLGWLLEAMEKQGVLDETLLIVAAARGFALGEHGWVGPADASLPDDLLRLHGELLHVPLLVRMPGGRAQSVRSRALAQPADLYGTLAEWYGLGAHAGRPQPSLSQEHPAAGRSLLPLVLDDCLAARKLAIAADPESNEFAARTDLWQLLLRGDERRLFVKPDDRWEVNDVADRAVEIADGMEQALKQFRAACDHPDAGELTLPEELTTLSD